MSVVLEADRTGMRVLNARLPAGAVVSVLLGGRRLWTFRVPEPGPNVDDGHVAVPWPAPLAERWTGTGDLAVASGGEVLAEATIRFDDRNVPFQLVEPGTGIPQVINKWGRIARSFEGRDPDLIQGVLDETEHLIDLMFRTLGLDLFVTGGTLLGPVRDGRILPNDDDADLAYLSSYDNPSDIVLESYRIERTLTGAGYDVVRHSGGHLQLNFPGGTVTDSFYIDIFTYFITEGWFYGPFHAREPAATVTVLPLQRIDVNGRQLPAPANPEQMLGAIYGSTWRTPDPAFRFVTPPAAARRFFWWLNHYDVDRENWEDTHRGAIAAGTALRPTAFARRVAGLLPPSSTLLELGCGLGADAQYLADLGHHVLAVDFSRPALTFAAERAETGGRTGGGSLRYERINLNAMRQVAHLRSLSASLPGPVSVYGRGIFNALSPLGWDTTLKLLQHLLAGTEARGYLEVEVGCDNRPQSWTDYGPVSFQRFQEQLTRYDLGIVENREDTTGSSGEVRTVRQVTVRGLT